MTDPEHKLLAIVLKKLRDHLEPLRVVDEVEENALKWRIREVLVNFSAGSTDMSTAWFAEWVHQGIFVCVSRGFFAINWERLDRQFVAATLAADTTR